MKNTPLESATCASKNQEMYRVEYAIQDGEHEYGDSIVLKSECDAVQEKAYKALAEIFGYGSEEKEEIVAALKSEGTAVIGFREIKDVSIHVVEAITIILRGGQIQDIQNIPEGGVIRIRDYDVEGAPDEETENDSDGKAFVESVWEGIPPIT